MLVELDLEKATDMAMQRERRPSEMNHRHRHQHLEGANEKGRVEVKVGACSLSREDGNENENEDEDEKVFVHLEREVAKCLLLSQRGKHDEALQGLKRAVLPQVEERVGRLQRDKERSAHTNLNLNSNGHSHSGDEMEEEEKNKSEDFEAGRPSSGKGSQWSRLKAKAYCVYATVLRNKSASSTSTSTSSGGVNAIVNANANGTEIDIDGRRHEGMEAMEAFEVALQADGDSAEVLLECGRACRSEAATVHKAVELHWRALRLYPGSATLKRELACSLNDLGTFFKNTAKDGELREDVVRVALNLIDAYLGNSSEEKDREGSKNHVVEADHEAEQQQQRQQQRQQQSPASASASASVSALLDGNSGPTASPLYERMYRTALAIDGEYSPSWYNMGVAYGEKGEMENAARAYLKALEFCPEYTEALCNYGALLRTQGNLKGAVEAFEKSLRLCPNHNMIKANLAATLCELGAQVKSEGTLGCDRNSALYRASLREAIQIYERAMALEPKHPLVLYNLGVAYSENGERQKSIAMYELTITFSPECAEAWNNLGVLLRDSGNIERAIECYQTAGRVNPKFGQPLNNLGIVYASRGAVKDSLQSFQAAIAASPSYAEVYNNLGVLYRDIGEMQDCLAAYRKCMDLDPQNRSAGHNLLMGLNYVHSGEEETLCEAHREWGETFAKQYRDYLPDLKHVGRDTYRQLLASSSSECYQDESKVTFFEHHTKLSLTDKDNRFELTEKDSLVLMDPEKELTLGYISPDLFTHSVSYFAEAPLTHHRNVKVIVYNVTPAPDAKTDRLKRLCAASLGVNGDKNVLWRDVTHLSELNLAKLIRKDGVDILVELTGHTANNRLAAMAMRPAPIQATWIGYPNSTGLKEVDYRITDEITDPKDTKQTYVEKLERLPGCFLCYTPAIDAPQVEALPVLSTGVFTFGTFNALAKVTNEVVELWACILREVPNSRLLIKSKPFLCETGRQRTQALFQSHGIDLDRVDLVPLIKSNHGHLAVYHHVDLALDPFPYAGTTTTCEALYMGVPSIIPAWGGGHAQMVGASLLQNVFGHDHGHHHHHQNASSHSPVDMEANSNSNINSRFIARSKQEYVELAIYHSRHWNELSALRSSLREKMLSSPLCQAKPFVAQLESVYRKWWKTLCGDKEREREREGVTRRERITKMNTSNVDVDVDDVNGSPNTVTVTGVTSEIQTAHNQRDHLLTASEENNVRENVKRICLEEPDCSSDCSSDQTSQLNC